MELYATIPSVDKPVSRLFFGTASKPFLAGENCNRLLDEMFDLGIQTIDSARNYQSSEISIGRWFQESGKRDQVVLLTKGGHPDLLGRRRINEKEIRKDIECSLRNLHTDYIDIYLLHRDDPRKPAGEIVEIFNALYREGKIRAFGGSNWTHTRIEEANRYAQEHGLIPLTVSSPNFSLAEQVRDPWGGGCVTLTGKDNEQARAWYQENGMPVIAYSSLGRGLLSGKITSGNMADYAKLMDEPARKGYACEENFERLRRCETLAKEKGITVSQVALAWFFRQPMNLFAIVSTSSRERMQANMEALNIFLTAEECSYLNLQLT